MLTEYDERLAEYGVARIMGEMRAEYHDGEGRVKCEERVEFERCPRLSSIFGFQWASESRSHLDRVIFNCRLRLVRLSLYSCLYFPV
jgi:hypothetical protein